jgi:hypothetical protein
MAKTIVKKSIKVEDILHSLNWQLANQHEHHNGGRAAMMMLVEDILHTTGNYRGFRYLEQHEVPNDCKPGIQPKTHEGPDTDNNYRFLDTDPTRVRYI